MGKQFILLKNLIGQNCCSVTKNKERTDKRKNRQKKERTKERTDWRMLSKEKGPR